MTPSPDHAAPEVEAPDPEIQALLTFAPVPRKYKRANAWTPALQRRFIAELARTGSPAKACEAVGKDRFGVEKVYKAQGAESFREAWDAAIALFEERDAERQVADRQQWVGVRPPGGIDKRMDAMGRRQPGPEAVDDADDMDAETKMAMVEDLTRRFMAKVQQEREARLAGQIVAADFYLRQVTAIEVALI